MRETNKTNSVQYNFINQLSRLDHQANLFLASNKCANINLSKRFIFPRTESPKVGYSDNRSSCQKFKDIIEIINSKLNPEHKELWD